MKSDSKLFRLVFVSPWPLLIFLIIPILVVVNFSLHLQLPLTNSKYPFLYNNACLTLFIALRFLYYLQGIPRGIRYGACARTPRRSTPLPHPAGVVRSKLVGAGYVFNSAGCYGEKRDIGYLGTTILYAGILLFLFTGTWDNMHQYLGSVLDGIGVSTDLNRPEAYRRLTTGPLTRRPETLPRMKILKQFIPDATQPRGAVEIAFVSVDGKEQTVILKAPTDVYQAGAYDISMSKMVYQPTIAITINNSTPVFNGQISLNQMAVEEDGFGFFGTFVEGALDGKVYYQPEKSRLKVIVHQGAELLLDTDLVFQVDKLSRSANFTILCEKMGVWSEIRVMHRRHMNVIWVGGIGALIGLLMRAAIRPQRVWLEEDPEGCLVRMVGKETERWLKSFYPTDSLLESELHKQ